ncbi:restriction endonuclease subunit S [Staphylococcus epidermidis]|uniref:restriction endonuclease subunit S n=1 Tax=Staphylococcus epidermidis TaxID=1282 RepID=UPI001C3EF198|nr:restriction endonuclease subunit S [Staphylococcus epidermidis]MBV5463129.1 restriction endonuclease subunit S [Staphylococcus epidermidis]
MTSTKRLVPELRFPEFNGEWEKRKLKDIAKFQNGKAHEKLVSISGDFVLVNSKFISTNTQVKKFVSQQLTPLNKEDIAIVMSDIPNGKALAKCFLVNENNKYTLNQRVGRIYDISGDSRFLYAILNRNTQLLKYDNGVGQTNLKKSEITHIVLKCPKNAEQKKIGDFFSKLDRQIELEEKKLELLEQQKKGYMQKIFSQELRFKDENGNAFPKWVTQKIKELGNVYTGNTPSKKQSTYWNSNNYIWVTPTDINNKKDLKNSEYMLSNEGFKKARQLPKNTLLITCIASIGKNAILREEGSCNQQINALVPNSDKNVDFLYYAFEKVSKYMKRIAGKTATQIVNKSTFENISIEVPNFEEQLKAGRFLNSFDKLIEKQVSKIELLKQRKQGFLQKMFV